MVACAGGYYGKMFQGFRGVTQGEPLSPTIFNAVVDAVVCPWAAVAEEREGGKEGRGREVRHQSILLYVDDGTLSSTDLE